MALGLGLKLGFGGGAISGIVSKIKWLATFVLDLISTIGPNITSLGTSSTGAQVWDSGLGLKIEEVPPGPVSEGERITYDTDEGATLGSEIVGNAITDYSIDTGATRTLLAETLFGEDVYRCSSKVGTASAAPLSKALALVDGEHFSISIFARSVNGYNDLSYFDGDNEVPVVFTADGEFHKIEAEFIANGTSVEWRTSGAGQNEIDLVFPTLQPIIPAFLNDDGSGIKLHPTKQLTENGVTSTVFLLYDFRADSEDVSIGDHRYIIGADNHNYALTCSTGGTTHTSPPAVVAADIGSTVAEDGGTVVWDVDHYYSNLATATTNYLPHILNEPEATQQLLNSDAPVTQTTGSLATGFYTLSVKEGTGSVDLTAGTATIDGTGSASLGVPFTFEVTVAGTVTATKVGTVDKFQLEGGDVPTSFMLSGGATVTRDATSFITPDITPTNNFAVRGRFIVQDGTEQQFLIQNAGDDKYTLQVIENELRLAKNEGGVFVGFSTSSPTILNGKAHHFGISFSDTNGMTVSLDGVPDATPLAVFGDFVRDVDTVIGESLLGGTTDLTIYNGADYETWRDDITWSQPE